MQNNYFLGGSKEEEINHNGFQAVQKENVLTDGKQTL